MNNYSIKNKQKGFTLIELIVGITVSGIAIALAFKAWSGFFNITHQETKKSKNYQNVYVLLPTIIEVIESSKIFDYISADTIAFINPKTNKQQILIARDSSLTWKSGEFITELKVLNPEFYFLRKVESEDDKILDIDYNQVLDFFELDTDRNGRLELDELNNLRYGEIKFNSKSTLKKKNKWTFYKNTKN